MSKSSRSPKSDPRRALGAQGEAVAAQWYEERGFVVVDEFFQTTRPGVYAIGDVTGKLLLAHVGSAQGIVAAEHIAGHETRALRDVDYAFMPRCTYCRPQVASMGYTEAQARDHVGARHSKQDHANHGDRAHHDAVLDCVPGPGIAEQRDEIVRRVF